MEEKIITVRLTFTESILGTAPANDAIYADFIGSKAPDAETLEEEVAALGADSVAEKGMTIFSKTEDGTPFLYDYHIKGFMKSAAAALRKLPGTESSKVKAFKKVIDTMIFPAPRQILFENYGTIGRIERSLRADTPQGPRVGLACSEEIQAGATVTFSIYLLDPGMEKLVKEWLDYGKWYGIGQWRNASHGRYMWDELDADGNVIGGNNSAQASA